MKNLRSGVSRVAVGAVGELLCQLQRGMDQELEGLARALLLKAGESNAFIRQDVDAALDSMVQHCTPARCTCALIAGGLGSGPHTHTHTQSYHTMYVPHTHTHTQASVYLNTLHQQS